MMRILRWGVLLLVLAMLSLLAMIYHFASIGEGAAEPSANAASATSSTRLASDPQQVARGAYLARAGNCVACHSVRGMPAYSGGRAIATPFGEVIAPNITPDPSTGIGNWSQADFWRAMHHGKGKDGRMLYPAFPYPNYTKVTRADADALFAYLQSLAPVNNPRQPHRLRFPYNQQVMLASWRALYFRPGEFQPDPKQSTQYNRGAYLVQGLGHCNACHTSRNLLGASDSAVDLAGGMIPVLNWYAPSLTSDKEAGLGSWQAADIHALLKTGVAPQSAVFGPMAEVVAQSLQHLDDADIHAMAAYLKALPQTTLEQSVVDDNIAPPERERLLAMGAKLYETHCQDCHQADGRGKPPGWPPLAGNRAITMPSAVNSIRMVLNGGFAPSTAGNPRPYGMPPYGPSMSDEEVAAVVSYIRQAWGNGAAGRALVDAPEVNRYRSVPLD
ncbi:MAG: hypothetical protein RL748_4457 [Pseudomonadota bacterium]|jgi:mono/diheme cytochrome c family protein